MNTQSPQIIKMNNKNPATLFILALALPYYCDAFSPTLSSLSNDRRISSRNIQSSSITSLHQYYNNSPQRGSGNLNKSNSNYYASTSRNNRNQTTSNPSPPPNTNSFAIDIVQAGQDERSICEAASFLVDAFWLDPRHSVNARLERHRRYPGRPNTNCNDGPGRNNYYNGPDQDDVNAGIDRERSDYNKNGYERNNGNRNYQQQAPNQQRYNRQGRSQYTINEGMMSSNNRDMQPHQPLLQQPQQQMTRYRGNNSPGPAQQVPQHVKRNLFDMQANDLLERYGRQANSILNNCILKATNTLTGETLGLLCISSLLYDTKTEELLLHEDSEALLKAAVNTLELSQDRQRYRRASAEVIARDLLGGELVAVCIISNLAVLPAARRLGIAAELCEEAERVASMDWGFDAMLLKVEATNHAARRLYESKLGYRSLYKEPGALAFRVDLRDGRFVETNIDTLILAKDI